MDKRSFCEHFTLRNNFLFLILLLLVLVAGNIYQYQQVKELKSELEDKMNLLSQSPFQKTEPINGESPERPVTIILPTEADISINRESPKRPVTIILLAEADIPKGAILLEMSTYKIEPDEFEVKAGQEIILAVTALDSAHVLKFKEEGLKDVVVGVVDGMIKVITFDAPKKTGEYHYYCDVLGHELEGGKGVMRVVE